MEGVLPPFAPVEVGVDQILEATTRKLAIERPASGDVTDDQHSGSIPTRGEIFEESADSSYGLPPALAAGIRDIEEVLAVVDMPVHGAGVSLSEVTLS